jgi:drug/metabolite transporter (DMT)-like permease
MQPDVLLPLCSGFGYAVAALLLKRATDGGVGPWRAMFVTNWINAVVLGLWWFTGGKPFEWEHLGHAVLTGAVFFIAQIFVFLALSRGDVSVATPVLGTKVIFVVLFTKLLTAAPVPGAWWNAALLTAIGTALLGGGGKAKRGAGTGIVFGFIAAALFSLTDVWSQMWAPGWGFGHFAPVVFGTVGLLSFGLMPIFREPLRAIGRVNFAWLLSGALLIGLQVTGVAYSVMVFGAATKVNVLYNTRGVWSVLLVWAFGHWVGNTERSLGTAILTRRLVGAILLLAAIVLVTQ